MTLVALAVREDCVEILTDSHAYGAAGEGYVRCSKATVFPHLDAVATGKGPGELLSYWKALILDKPQHATDVDGWADVAESYLPELWEQIPDPAGNRRGSGRVVFAGWSSSRQRFVGYEFRAEDGFRRTDLTDQPLTLMPAASVGGGAPSGDEEWAALGQAVYEAASLDVGLIMRDRQTYIGGDLVLTRVERGRSSQRTVLALPEHDWQHRQMLVGSLHLYGQAGPCVCGSGQPALLCHLFVDDGPCRCGSGRPFPECHRFSRDHPSVREHWRKHAADFRRTRHALAATWLEVRPDEEIPATDYLRSLMGLPAGVI